MNIIFINFNCFYKKLSFNLLYRGKSILYQLKIILWMDIFFFIISGPHVKCCLVKHEEKINVMHQSFYLRYIYRICSGLFLSILSKVFPIYYIQVYSLLCLSILRKVCPIYYIQVYSLLCLSILSKVCPIYYIQVYSLLYHSILI